MPRAPRRVLSHWYHLVDDFQASTADFYSAVEQAIREREAPDIAFERVEWKEKGIFSANRTYLRVKRGRITFDICCASYGRGCFFSWWMAETPSYAALGYLILLLAGLCLASVLLLSLVGHNAGVACGSLFLLGGLWVIGVPVGFFFLGKAIEQGALGDEAAVLATPVLGFLYALFFNPYSYYRLDTALMFQETVSRSVGESLNAMLSGQGADPLSASEQAPSMQRFLSDRS